MPEMDGFSVAEAIKEGSGTGGDRIVMLTSAGRQGDGARCRALGIAAYLMKPVSQTELLEAILAVLGMPSDGPDRLHVVTRHSLRESRRTLRILLAEDNKVNQLVAARCSESAATRSSSSRTGGKRWQPWMSQAPADSI